MAASNSYGDVRKLKKNTTEISPLGIRSAPWLKYRFVLGPPGWPFVLKLICSSHGRSGYWEGICVDSSLICPKIGRLSVGRGRSPGFGSGSGSSWIGALGRGVRAENLISGPRPAKLERQSKLLTLRIF